MTVLPGAWKVPDTFHARLGEHAGRQRIISADGHLLLILHKIPQPGNADREAVFFWRNPAGEWKSTGGGSGLAELKGHLNEYTVHVDKLEGQIQEIPSSQNYFRILHATTPLLRSVRNMHKALQEAREAIPADRHILIARDQAGELERAVELLHTDSKNGLDYMIARQAEEQARNSEQLVQSGYKLNLLIAIFLPLTALGSAFGMNLRHGFEHVTNPLLFWVVLACGMVMGFLVKGAVSTKKP